MKTDGLILRNTILFGIIPIIIMIGVHNFMEISYNTLKQYGISTSFKYACNKCNKELKDAHCKDCDSSNIVIYSDTYCTNCEKHKEGNNCIDCGTNLGYEISISELDAD